MPFHPFPHKKLQLLFCLVLFFNTAFSQDYIIKHDFHSDYTSYFKIDKNKDTIQVKEISFKKPGRIVLKVENFNPFYWNAKVTSFQKPVEEQSSYVQVFTSFTKSLGLNLNFSLPPAARGVQQGQQQSGNQEAVMKGLEFNQ